MVVVDARQRVKVSIPCAIRASTTACAGRHLACAASRWQLFGLRLTAIAASCADWTGACRGCPVPPLLDKARTPCAFRALSQITHNAGPVNASLPHPYLRRASRERHRQGRAAFGLVPPHPRPWRRAVHRSARPLRPDPGGGRPRQPGLQGRREAARRMGGADRRQGARAPGRHRESRPADRHGRSLHHARSRCWARRPNCRCRCSAIRNIRRISGSNTASSICAASSCTTTS